MIYPVTRISGRKVKTSPKDAIYVTDRRRKDYGSLISFSGEYNYREVNLFFDEFEKITVDIPVETVILPKYLRKIGDYTFKECVSLKHVKINSSLEVIGEFAFEGCKALKELTLPSSVKKIGNFCFSQSSVALRYKTNQERWNLICMLLIRMIVLNTLESHCLQDYLNKIQTKSV